MSFGFSIGDIILLSQLAYSLYSSVSSGRKAASRDLQELGDVLFSLKCSLDHLGEVSEDVLAQPDRHGGAKFKEKLDAMMSGCASTLQELESVTEKYRTLESHAVAQAAANQGKKKSVQVNWNRVRWDYEKQSLQQYRDKLKSHTDAINLILTSMIWANSALAGEKSRQNHEKTHSLLEEVLKKPQADDLVRSIVEEIRSILTQQDPGVRAASNGAPSTVGPPSNFAYVAAYSLSASSIGPPIDAIASSSQQLPSGHASAGSVLQTRSSGRAVTNVMFAAGGIETPPRKRQQMRMIHNGQSNVANQKGLSLTTDDVNARRRAVGVREYEAFRQRHTPPKKRQKPSFLKPTTPTIEELHDCIPYIFTSLPEGKQQTDELKHEMGRWTQGLFLVIRDNRPDAESDARLLAFLATLNEAVGKSTKAARRLFYEVSDSMGLLSVLDQISTTSKSVRVMREIEEFQDAKEEWEDDRGGD